MIAEWAFSIINKGIVGSHYKKNSFDGLKVRQQNSNASIIKQIIKILWIFINGYLNDSNNYEEMSQYRYIFHKDLYANSEILFLKS